MLYTLSKLDSEKAGRSQNKHLLCLSFAISITCAPTTVYSDLLTCKLCVAFAKLACLLIMVFLLLGALHVPLIALN